MSNGSRPAILLSELLRGEGPHRELADRFTEAKCVSCGGDVGRLGSSDSEHWFCPGCWARHSAQID